MKLILYGHRKYEPFQTKDFVNQGLSSVSPALMNTSLTLGIICSISSRLTSYSIPLGRFRSSETLIYNAIIITNFSLALMNMFWV